MTMQSQNEVNITGDTTYVVSMDVSKMITMMQSMQSMGTWSLSTDVSSSKNICTEFDNKKWDLEKNYTNISCQSTGDYKAKITSTLPKVNNAGIIVSDDMILIDPFWIKNINNKTRSMETEIESAWEFKKNGAIITGDFQFPYPIVYQDAGTRIGTNSIQLDMLDSSVLSRNNLLIVARRDGQIPSKKDIINYKKMLRIQIMKAKRSGKYNNIEDMLSM
jgi:hypothetical protein